MAEPVTVVIDGFLCDDGNCPPSPFDSPNPIGRSGDLTNVTHKESVANAFNSTTTITTGLLSFNMRFFDVISVSVFGITPPSVSNQTFALNGQSSQYSQPSYQGQLFIIPDPNNIASSYDFAEFVTFDYILITASNNTNLAGQTILLDDSSSEIQWNGNWEEKPTNVTVGSHLNVPESITMAAHGNGTHVSSTEGDSFTFHFAGTSIKIFGVIFNQTADFTIQATIDGQQNTRTIDPVFAGGNSLLFATQNDLPPGNHTLVFTIQQLSDNAVAAIDYILYTPSFQTIRDKPVFSPQNLTSPPGGGDGEPQPAAPKSSGPNLGAIIGGAIGGVVFCVLVVLGLWIWRRRKRQNKRTLQQLSDQAPDPFIAQPNRTPLVTIPSDYHSSTHLVPSVQSPASAPLRDHWSTNPKGAHVLQVSAAASSTTSPDRQSLRHERDVLAERMEQMEMSQAGGSESSRGDLEAEMREMRARMDALTREMSKYVTPPAYADNEHGESGFSG